MVLMMLSIQVSATLMRVFFTLLFPSWMSPLQPFIIANSSVHSAASFVRLMFLPQWILCFSTAQHYSAPFFILLQFLLHSCRTQLNCGIWYHLNPTQNPSMKVPVLCSRSRVSGQCYCPGWISTPRNVLWFSLGFQWEIQAFKGLPEFQRPHPRQSWMHHIVLN